MERHEKGHGQESLPKEPPTQKVVKRAHVNMMTDTIIANLPADGLRSAIRSILTLYPEFTGPFEEQVRGHLQKSQLRAMRLFSRDMSGKLALEDNHVDLQGNIRSMLASGLVYESLPLFTDIVDQCAEQVSMLDATPDIQVASFLVSIDGDIVQAVTSIQKKLITPSGTRLLTNGETVPVLSLLRSLQSCEARFQAENQASPFERSLIALEGLLVEEPTKRNGHVQFREMLIQPPNNMEVFSLGGHMVPRLFCGLWQLSSPAWGSASQSKIMAQFENYVTRGFTAFDMADHYGDAEIMFGLFRQSCRQPKHLFGATKYCVFGPTEVTQVTVRANVTERCTRMRSENIDLLQFHWQDYSNPSYLDALRILQQDERVSVLGLCNFDTEHMETVLNSNINIATNQVQFSLIDCRPIFKMAKTCEKYNVKLLTYGTLCGGWLSDKWLGKNDPELFLSGITPSQRKYYEMILSWGGWALFQELLQTLSNVASKHGVLIANVATRWVLDFPYVGAVLVGSRMGISERADENLASYGWHLDDSDREAIEKILERSRRKEVFEAIGDCGGEYR